MQIIPQRYRFVLIVGLCLVGGVSEAETAVAAELALTYAKQSTRAATYDAAQKAAGFPVFGVWYQAAPFDPLLRKVQGPDENSRLD